MSETLTTVYQDQVVSVGRGVVKFIDESGRKTSRPISSVTIIDHRPGATFDPGINPAPKEPASMAPESALIKPVKEKKVAKSKKSVKAAVAGVHKLGDSEFDLTRYTRVKTAKGTVSYHNGDPVALKLAGKDLDEVYEIVAKALNSPVAPLKAKYRSLNAGQQRMNLGNRLRKVLRPKLERKAKKAA